MAPFLRYADLLLSVGGAKLFIRTKLSKKVNEFFRGFLLISVTIKIIVYLIICFLNADTAFRAWVFVCKYLTVIGCQQTLVNNGNKLKGVLYVLTVDLNRAEKRKIARYDRNLGIAWGIFVLAKFGLYVTYLLATGPEIVLDSIYDWKLEKVQLIHYILGILNLIWYSIFGSGFLMATMGTYALIEAIFAAFGNNWVERLKTKSNKNAVAKMDTLRTMRKQYRIYNELRKSVNRMVGQLPFLWAFMLFVEISGGITEVAINRNKYQFFAWVYIVYEIVSYSLCIFGLCLFCDRTTGKLEAAILSGLRSLEPHHFESNLMLNFERNSLMLEMTIDPIVPAYGWNIFPVNKKLVLTFLGSVIPFSVMVITGILQSRNL